MLSGSNSRGNQKISETPSRGNILDWIFFLRPILHSPVWTIVILGYFKSSVRPDSPYLLIWLLLISSGLAGWAYIVNQIADIESDRRNNKLFFLPLQLISKRAAFVYAGFIGGITLFGSFLLGMELGFISLAGICLGYIYSGKPFHGKNHPVAGTILNGAGHGSLMFILGFVGTGGLIGDAVFFSVPYLFAVIAVYIGTTLPDILGDAACGKRTPGVTLGINFSIVVMTLSLMVALLLSLLLWDITLLVVSNLCIPFFLYALVKRDVKSAVLAVRMSVLLLSIAACVRLPWYAVVLALLFGATRIYYHRRFKITYPSLA